MDEVHLLHRAPWPCYLACLVVVGWLASSSRAEVFVSALDPGTQAKSVSATGFVGESSLTSEEPNTKAVEETEINPAVLLASVLFFKDVNTVKSTKDGGGSIVGTGSGTTGGQTSGSGSGSNPPGEAPEPATLLTGLIGTGLAGLYAAYRRRKAA